jgi:UDP-N-acetylenolpyruvoylglucosamine reductase
MITEFVNYKVYNHTYKAKRKILYPKNFSSLFKSLRYLKKLNIKPIIISGNCGHGDKSFLSESEYIVSLEKLNKVIRLNTKKKIVEVQAGVNLYNLFKLLQKKNYFVFNIPGGKKISVGGAVAGNVHGRPQLKNFTTFGDNIVYIKYIDENFKLKKVTNNNLIFKKLIGSLGIYGIIVEVGIKIFKIKHNLVKKIDKNILNTKDFIKYSSQNNSFYGFINYFEKKKIVGNFTFFDNSKANHSTQKKRKIDLLNLINIFKFDSLISFFINQYTLRIFYFAIFNLKNFVTFNKMKSSITNFENSIYFVNINTYLPYYFRKGMVEIQFSVNKKNLLKIINEIKNAQFKDSVFPIFFIVKKMHKIKENYFFQFPLYEYCISLGYTKEQTLENNAYFKKLYEIMFKNNCNLYITKDETVLNFSRNFKNKLKTKVKKLPYNSNDFYQKLLT